MAAIMGPMQDIRQPGSFAETLQRDPEAWAIRIRARWQMGVEAIISTGRLLLEAKEILPHGAFTRMVEEQLPFKIRMAQMLMTIAANPLFSNAQYIALLPPTVTTMYDCARLTPPEFERGVVEGIINPEMERADIERIRPRVISGSDGRADEAMAREPAAVVGVVRDQPDGDRTTMADEQAGMGSERPSPSEATPEAPAAHMAGRVHPAGDLDYSPTPPWATRALVERVLRHAGREGHCKFQSVWEPACGEGHMAEVLREYFRSVFATDIDERNGYPDAINDFLANDGRGPGAYDWIITNPPFEERVIKFMDRALDLAGTGVAMFVQLRYLEGIGRYERIYRDRPPSIVAPFVERVPLLMGRYDPEASTTTAFMWLVWLKGAAPQAPFWIPPGSAKALTKPDDAVRFTQHPVQKRNEAPASEAAE